MASQPGDESSVTSKRRRFQPASADVIAPPMPGLPFHVSSARRDPGAAGWLTQGMLTVAPTIPATAHSMCGQSAAGAEWTCRTPYTDTGASLRTRFAFPSGLGLALANPYSLRAHGFSGVCVIFCRRATTDTSVISKKPAPAGKKDQRGQSGDGHAGPQDVIAGLVVERPVGRRREVQADRDHAVLRLAEPGQLPAAGVVGDRVAGQRGLDDRAAGLRGAQRGEGGVLVGAPGALERRRGRL